MSEFMSFLYTVNILIFSQIKTRKRVHKEKRLYKRKHKQTHILHIYIYKIRTYLINILVDMQY